MTPTFARGARGRCYRYYVSAPLQQGRPRLPGDQAIRRVSAAALESTLDALLGRLLPDIAAEDRLPTLSRTEVHARALDLLLPARLHPGLRPHLHDHAFAVPEAD